ncbi:MAG: ATP-binding cassette domain-containing protein [Calditrichaceae bacterium]|nr:ATP-binding cassette domain-containing protein [Calditrichia bacterium]NUQ41294.1 ATP-binding cassette domain-containing protein [Calditrichaceae bacterium]
MNTVVAENISKSFNSFRAVDSVSLAIRPGSVFGLLGPNGAGKTTTMRMIVNIILPDSGSIHLFGEPFREEHKNRIGYLPEERGLYPKMKVIDHLQFLGEMKGIEPGEAQKQALQWLERFELADRAQKKVQELSKGLQQKVQFIATIIHAPELLIVDEPFSGLDPLNTKFLKDILLGLKQAGKTIILSTHLMEQAEKLCDEICLINKGKAVLQGNLREIKRRYGHNMVNVEYSGNAEFLRGLPPVKSINDYGNSMEIRLHDGAAPGELFKLLAAGNLEVRRFETAETPLNEIFIDVVEKS